MPGYGRRYAARISVTHFADLSPCTYFPFDAGDQFTAVGWLESDHEYSRGPVTEELVARLTQLLVNPWQPWVTMGWHNCEFCRFSRGSRQFTFENTTIDMGISNLFVPAADTIFVAPSLIVHYIDAHEYSPPQQFQNAVLACPEMRSMKYLKAIRKQAPKEMFSAISSGS